MKIGILHLTDLHLKESNDNWIEDKVDKLVASLKTEYEDCVRVYIIITGDITFSGKEKEFEKAKTLLNRLLSLLKIFYKGTLFEKIIVIPGNHDCDFQKNNMLRMNILKNDIDYKYIGEDDSVIETCLIVQDNYFKFSDLYNKEDVKSKLLFQFEDEIDGKLIIFNCINTAWMSSKEEQIGGLFFPVTRFSPDQLKKGDLSITLFHHDSSWLNSNTTENNKVEFTSFIQNISDIVLCGHEHNHNGKKEITIRNSKELLYFSGEALQYSKTSTPSSGFHTLLVDLDTLAFSNKVFTWKDGDYKAGSIRDGSILIDAKTNKKFNHSIAYLNLIDKVKLPLIFDQNKEIRLKQLFVFPDLESKNEGDKDIFDEFLDSSDLLNIEKYDICFIEGENQSGKSTLLRNLYLLFTEKDIYPLLIDGKAFSKGNIDKILENAFEEQYQKANYDEYAKLDNNKKVLLIDDIHKLEFSSNAFVDLIKRLKNRFSIIIMVSSTYYSHISSLNSEFKNVYSAKLLPLGYKKRNKLITNYHRATDKDFCNLSEQLFLDKVKNSYEKVQTFLGNRIIPSYPVFILSILQSVHLNAPINLEQTSYGYCYHSLIHVALSVKAQVKNEHIDSYFNFLSELAFWLFEQERDSITESEFESFYHIYSLNYNCRSYIELNDKITTSLIIIKEDGRFKFGYNYIYYFLVARKISEIINGDKGKKIIKKLCQNLHDDNFANILIFVAHHSKDNHLIDEAIFASMEPFEHIKPITLEKDGQFYNLLKDIVTEFKDEIINTDVNPTNERENLLERSDEIERESNQNKYTEDSFDENDKKELSNEVMSFHKALRSIEIVGQIIKNRNGSIKKEKLSDMICELYLTGFRTIGFLGEIIRNSKDVFIKKITEDLDQDVSKNKIEEKLNKFFQLLALDFCLSIFAKIISSVGTSDLKQIFEDVAKKMNTPAAKLVSYSINTNYNKINIGELKILAKEFEKNPVALNILKARIRAYIYNNYLEFSVKQKIASALNLNIVAVNSIKGKSKELKK